MHHAYLPIASAPPALPDGAHASSASPPIFSSLPPCLELPPSLLCPRVQNSVGLYGPDGDPPDIPGYTAIPATSKEFDWLNILRGGGNGRVGFNYRQMKNMVWTQCALFAPDQLRQRVAWAFAQIFVVGGERDGEAETYVAFYDIFVRQQRDSKTPPSRLPSHCCLPPKPLPRQLALRFAMRLATFATFCARFLTPP